MTDQNNTATGPVANKKNLIISGAVILLVLLGLFVVPSIGNKKAGTTADESAAVLPEGCEPGDEVSVTTGEPCVSKEATPATATTALSRADATAKYVGSIIRFSGDCTAEPAELKTTVRATVMIDNDTDTRRTIMVGQKSYNLGAGRYTLSSMNMGLGEHTVSCDGKPVSKITIQ